jgi:hypothetical protein
VRLLAVSSVLLAALQGSWTRLADPPFTRSGTARVATSRGLIVWGGSAQNGSFAADGARYDLTTGRWRRLPRAPIAGRADPAAVWTGSSLIVWGGWAHGGRALGDGAAYADGRWRRLPRAPLSARAPAAWAWTGKEFLVWGDTSRLRSTRDGAAYDPATRRWRSLPRAPLALNQVSAIFSHGELFAVGAQLDDGNSARTRFAQGIAYDPRADRWRVLRAYSLSPQASTISAAGRDVLVWDYVLGAGIYDPRRRTWSKVTSPPLRASECYPTSATVGGFALGWYCGTGALFDAAARRWRPVAPPGGVVLDSPVGVGPIALLLGMRGGGSAELWEYRPG